MIATKAQLIEAGFTIVDAPDACGCWLITRNTPFYYFRPRYECNQTQVVDYCITQGDGLYRMVIPGQAEDMVLPFCFIEQEHMYEMRANIRCIKMWEAHSERIKAVVEAFTSAGSNIYDKVTST